MIVRSLQRSGRKLVTNWLTTETYMRLRGPDTARDAKPIYRSVREWHEHPVSLTPHTLFDEAIHIG